MKAKVKGYPDLLKDTRSGAILNTNREELEEYKAKKAALRANRNVQNVEERLNKLEDRMDELKDLLLKAISNGTS